MDGIIEFNEDGDEEHHFWQRGKSVSAQFQLLKLAQLVQAAGLQDLKRCW